MSSNDLDQLDQRGRAAGADLRQRAAARSVPAFDAAARTDLEVPVPLAPRRARDPRVLAVAAAVVVALLAGAVWAATRGGGEDEDPTGVTTTDPRPFRPTYLPDGFELAGAADVRSGEPLVGDAAPLVLYGPGPVDPRAGVTWFGGEEVSPNGVRTIEVGGRTARVLDSGGMLATVVALDAPGGNGWYAAISSELDEDQLARLVVAASGGRDGVQVDEDALPDGWRRLGEDPRGLFGGSSVVAMRGGAVPPLRTVVYGRGGMTDETEASASSDDDPQPVDEPIEPTPIEMVSVTSTRGDELVLASMGVIAPDVEEVEVRGHRARLSTADLGEGVTTVGVAWLEAPGELVTVSGTGVARNDVLRIADSLEVVPTSEWKDLVERTSLGDLQPGEDQGTELGRGEFADGTAWVLRDTSDDPSDPQLSLRVALSGDSASSSNGTASGPGSLAGPESKVPPLLDLIQEEVGGRRFVAVLVSPAVARVELRTAAGEVVAEGMPTALAAPAAAGWVVLEAPADVVELAVIGADGAVLDTTTVSDMTGGEETEGGETTPTSVEGSSSEGPEPSVSVETVPATPTTTTSTTGG